MRNWFNRVLPVGARSVLIGAHCFFLHPWFVALAWWKLYGFPRDWRLWVAFFIHDLGYLFYWTPDMDGPSGETHPFWAARLMGRWFGPEWYAFCLYHSRFLAKRAGVPFSRLCVADKLACALEPWWLYLPRVWLSGELWEYMSLRQGRNNSKYAGEPDPGGVTEAMADGSVRGWHRGLVIYCKKWALEHQDGREDTWTQVPKERTHAES